MTANELFSDLQSKLEEEIHVGEWLEITQDRINAFAEATGDLQWIHTDVERAESESPFGTTAAHGFLTLSLIPHLTEIINPDKPLDPDAKLIVKYGLNRVRFPSPVLVGSRLRSRTVLQNVEMLDGSIQLTSVITVELEGGNKPACVAEAIIRLYY
ncbi:MAG: MaoC family dehydratase [Anaerolineales bacterium]|nr:MaoC family dehydratase [Anaerolineales bacterium]